MDKALAKAIIQTGDSRLERVFRHNFGLVRDVHPERIESLAWPDATGWEKLLSCPAATRTLSRDIGWIVPDAGPSGWIDLPAPRHRLGLLSWADQRRALWWFAMAVRFHELRRCIDGKQLRLLAEAGGSDARAFVLERGNIMVGDKVRSLLPGSTEAGLADSVEWAAAGTWHGVMGDAPADYVKRCRLLLPPRFEKRMRMIRSFSPEERRSLWLGLFKIMKEALPQWVDFYS